MLLCSSLFLARAWQSLLSKQVGHFKDRVSLIVHLNISVKSDYSSQTLCVPWCDVWLYYVSEPDSPFLGDVTPKTRQKISRAVIVQEYEAVLW